MVGGRKKKTLCIEFTSADGFWLIAISVSSQAANASPASPTSKKERQMRERSEKNGFSVLAFQSDYLLLHHYSYLPTAQCCVSYQTVYNHHRSSFQTICFNVLMLKRLPYFRSIYIRSRGVYCLGCKERHTLENAVILNTPWYFLKTVYSLTGFIPRIQ